MATWRFGQRGKLAPVTVYWYDGGLRPPTPAGLDPDDARQRVGEGRNGVYFVGEKGILTCGGWSGMPRLLPLELHRDYKRPAKTLPRVEGGHHADWLQGLQGRAGPRAATSTTRRGSRSSSCSATSRCVRGSRSGGTPRT